MVCGCGGRLGNKSQCSSESEGWKMRQFCEKSVLPSEQGSEINGTAELAIPAENLDNRGTKTIAV
jgi:hypothetical protein